MKRCPACESSRFWRAPVGYIHVENRPGLFKRCEVCTGWGITTDSRIMSWELSL